MTETGRPAHHQAHSSSGSAAAARENARGWAIFTVAATVLAVVSVGSLAAMLLLKWAGAAAWPGLAWIAMIGLPVAFVMMGIGVLRAIARRRSL
ncbi:hypothetical protein [Arthrobacter sp. 35W]|uniref:hypothetical protein n=1 Tax=Arthrobacter sp. 35W TaxID=1132441 RepID=UPI0004053D4F|nr:hypothetical protein [Arthrobacter sp. 35W]